jgi:CSLREA domain-containing protein
MKIWSSVRRLARVQPQLVIIALIVSFLAPVAPAARVAEAATTITVSTTADTLSPDGRCSLREAIIAANKNQASGNRVGECPAGSGADTVLVPPGDYVLTRTDNGREDASTTGDLDIRESVAIVGDGRVRIAGGPGFSDRILDVISGELVVRNVTITGGNSRLDGGGIQNRGTLTLESVTLTGNSAALQGGGVQNWGTAQLTNVTVSGNFAGVSGGGLYNAGGSVNLNNVTIALNTADADGNGTGDGGGVSVAGGVFAPGNSIIGRNLDLSAAVRRRDCSGVVQSQGYNLIEDTAGCTITGSPAGNVTGQDPTLGLLAQNEGSTDTHALLIGSPALGAGNPLVPGSGGLACAGVDQRGFPRPSGPRCDMGAFERQTANDSWPTALELSLAGDPLSTVYQQHIDQPGQSRWYRFDVQPQSRLVVTLTNLPANYDLTVYRDIAAAFKDVTTPDDLERLGAEFAPDAFSPDAFSPDAFSPDAFSPDAFSPDAFSPDAFSPDAFSPDAFSPDAFSPDAFSPMLLAGCFQPGCLLAGCLQPGCLLAGRLFAGRLQPGCLLQRPESEPGGRLRVQRDGRRRRLAQHAPQRRRLLRASAWS